MRAITALLMLLLLGLTEADVQNIVTENEISSEKQNIVTENEISSLRQNLVTGSDISPEKQSIVTDSEISPDIQHMEVQRNTSEFQGDSWGSCQPDMCNLLMKIGAMEARLTASESKVDTLHTMNQGLALQLRNTETRLTTTEIELRNTETRLSTTEIELRNTETRLTTTEIELRNTETRLSTSEKQVEELKENAVKEQVVFSAGFGSDGDYGPFNTETTLVYKKVFINIGNGYNENTGIFTAPVRGVYHFTFYHHYFDKYRCQASLNKNGMVISSIACGRNYGMASNGITVQLEVGDQVYVRLWVNSWLYDSNSHFSNFNGILLFTE